MKGVDMTGLEFYDEDTDKWYPIIDYGEINFSIPWYVRTVVTIAGVVRVMKNKLKIIQRR